MQRIAICLLPGGSALAAHALAELLEGANALQAEPRFQVEWVAPDTPLRDWSQYWLVAPWRLLLGSEALQGLPLQALAAQGCLLGAVEGGSMLWAAAGLLQDRRAVCTDWLLAPLQQQHPGSVWKRGLWEIDGSRTPPLLSCARPLALPDLLLAWLARTEGEALTQQLAARIGLSVLRGDAERVLGEQHSDARHMPPRLAEALALMHANLGEPLPTEDVARLVGLSRRQLERLFKQHLDSLPSRHYLELRLQRARELLQRSGQSILQVGLSCGFSSGAHFSNAYKAAFGHTPRDERARPLKPAVTPQAHVPAPPASRHTG